MLQHVSFEFYFLALLEFHESDSVPGNCIIIQMITKKAMILIKWKERNELLFTDYLLKLFLLELT